MHDDGPHAPVVFDTQLEIGPPHEGRAFCPDVHGVEPAVPKRRTGTQVRTRCDLSNLTVWHEIRVELENLRCVYAKLEVRRRWSCEPGMPAEPRRPRPRVPADPKLELETADSQTQCLQGAAAEGPPQAPQLAGHRDRGLAPFDDHPRLVEAKTVDGGRRKVRLEPHLAVVRRDTAVGEAPRPGHHRIAAPVESGSCCPGPGLRQDSLATGDDQRDDSADVRWFDPHGDPVAA